MAEITEPEAAKPPESRSHSQISTLLGCPREYELAKVRRIKRRPGPWFPAGTAVHSTIEAYLRWSLARERNAE